MEILPDEDDDVYTEATPLARKVPVVDYQIIQLNNKPRYKIIRANGTHQLYVSFITLRKNFDREDLESLWNLVKERFSTSKPNNFSDDYLLTTFRAMFGRTDGQDQLILLVERRYPLLKFILDQMLNAVILQVEERSEMSLELLSFKVDAAMGLDKNIKCFNAAGEELSAAKHKLMLLDKVKARDTALVNLRQKLNQAEQERDDLKLKLDKFQTSFKNLTELLASQKNEKHGLGYFSLESNCESLSPSSPSDKLQPSAGYHAVPFPITRTFMPPKPDLVFHTAPIAVETDHSAFTVQLSPTKSAQDLSHINETSAPIIREWVSDSEDEYETNDPESIPSFVQSSEQVKTPRHSVQPVKAPVLDATLKPTNPKSNNSSKRKNRKTCFVCRSVDHLIKDYDYHAKKKVLTQSKPVSITAVRPVYAVVPKIMVTQPRHAHSFDTKSKLPIRRHITRSPSPKTSNSLSRVTAAQALVVSAAKEAIIRDVLHLDDAEGVDCLPNKEIFAELARMGYEKPSTKLTFYKAFFSSQWKFLIHTILQSMSAKCTSWNEFNSAMASAVIYLSTGEIKEQGDTEEQEHENAAQKDDAIMEDVSNQGRMIDEVDKDEGVPLTFEKEEEKKAEKEDEPEVQDVVEVFTIAKLITEFVTAASTLVSAASIIIQAAEPKVPVATTTAILVRVVAASTRRRKRVVIKDPEEESTVKIPAETKFKDKGKGIMVEKPKPIKKKQQKAAKRRKLNEEVKEVEDLKQHLEVMPDKDDDVYTEATPLARKVPIVDYQIVQLNNKPRYKIIRADGIHQLSPSDKLQPSAGYHAVPSLITRTFMPPKPDLVFHTAPIAVETDHSAFTVQLSPTKSAQDLSHINETSAPIIGEWPVKAPILDATLKPTNPKSNNSSKRKNRKTCFVCRSVDHLIKDCDYHAKKKVLTQSKPVSITAVRPVYAVVPKIMVTQPRHAHSFDTKSKLPIRRHITRSPSPKTSNSFSRVTAAQALVVSENGPDQTISGKDKSNPLMADNLPKVVWYSTHHVTLIDKKKVLITEAIIRDVLHLDDAKRVDCLPNKEIFAELARMGYEKPSIKLTFFKAFFSSQWKFLIHTILQSMSAKYTSWNEFNSAMASAVIYLSRGRKFNFYKYIFESLVKNINSRSKFYMYPRVGKGCSGVETPLFEGMLVVGEIEEQGDTEEQEHDNAAQEGVTAVVVEDVQEPSIPSPTLPPQPQDLPSISQHLMPVLPLLAEFNNWNMIKWLGNPKELILLDDTIMEDVSNQGRMIDEVDKDEGVPLTFEKEEEKKAEKVKDIPVLSMHEDEPEVQDVVEVFTISKLITEFVTAASTPVSAANTIIQVAEPKVPVATTTAILVRVVAASTRRRKRVVIRDPEEESTVKIPAKIKFKDKGKGIMDVAIDHVKQKAKEDSYVQRYQVMKKMPQTEAQDRRNMIMHLKNTVGFRLDYFKGMSYDDIHPIFEAKFNTNIEFLLKSKEKIEEEENREIESINETSAQKAAKRRKLNEEVKEVEDLKQHLEIMPDEDDDVYTEATPLAKKVPVMDYQIIQLNNKPRYKIIRADGIHQLYVSFITLLKNFDRGDLESLWNLVKERFFTSKPNNFSDDYLLTTLRATFGRTDGQDQVWKSQRSVYGQAMVKSWKLLESCVRL
nr:hypothetical protein [Tanacetum cinerariifolium]